ncbi:MAG: hypothetical protein FRX48_01370 [Lasallia pustulata]|uniref:Uncharacterized protein n=1 Tax=Lasallia pustulata TaxID=136370 RepID=A0A1W5DD03_9LECA|nr:MAG: hypothetical protein FRX48_01370 [Lasallia pustulata]SLM40802.1 hypothetical protein LPUS_11652 [Lasallia pustulata]
MSLWQSYRNLQPRTRLLLGLGLMGWAGLGILISDQAEKAFGMVPSEKDREELEKVVPRVRFVEREGGNNGGER